MEMIILIFILILFNIIIFRFNDLIAESLGLYDKPDFKRKIHLKKIPLTGGIFIFFNFILISLKFCKVKSFADKFLLKKNTIIKKE